MLVRKHLRFNGIMVETGIWSCYRKLLIHNSKALDTMGLSGAAGLEGEVVGIILDDAIPLA